MRYSYGAVYVLGIVFMACWSVIAVATFAEGATYTVDDDWAGADYSSIQDAHNASMAGDTINVYAGTYYEHLKINRTLTLTGNGSSDTIIDGSGSGTVVRIRADSVSMSGFNVTNGGTSKPYSGIYIDGDDCVISHCEVTDTNYGIHIGERWRDEWMKKFAGSGDVVMDVSGDVLIHASYNNVTKRNATTGAYITSHTSWGGGMIYGIAFGSDMDYAVVGNRHVGGYTYNFRVEYYNSTDDRQWAIEPYSGTVYGAYGGCRFDSQGYLYVAGKAASHGPSLVKMYANNGTIIWKRDDSTGGDWSPYYTDLAIDSEDNILLSGVVQGSPYAARIRKWSPGGTSLWYKSPGSSHSYAMAVGIDDDDNALFSVYQRTDSSSRLFLYDPSGNLLDSDTSFGSDWSVSLRPKSIVRTANDQWIVGAYTQDGEQDMVLYFLDDNLDEVQAPWRIDHGNFDDITNIVMNADKDQLYVSAKPRDTGSNRIIASYSVGLSDDAIIEQNDLVFNQYGVYISADGTGHTINDNTIASNAVYEMYDGGTADIDASDNHWGTIDEGEIQNATYDHRDDTALGTIMYSPWWDASFTTRYYADITPPTTTDDHDGLWHNSAVTITLTAVDSGSGVRETYWRLDGGAWNTGTSVNVPAPSDHSNDGTHILEYGSIDWLGNNETDNTISVMIDTTCPELRLRYDSSDDEVRFTAMDTRDASPERTVKKKGTSWTFTLTDHAGNTAVVVVQYSKGVSLGGKYVYTVVFDKVKYNGGSWNDLDDCRWAMSFTMSGKTITSMTHFASGTDWSIEGNYQQARGTTRLYVTDGGTKTTHEYSGVKASEIRTDEGECVYLLP
ncbi:MAG: hypothetical protein L0Z54_06110 [Thermoplasmata archaeon]|nr:hypothetical protein [Thermoplasmata archaeon]